MFAVEISKGENIAIEDDAPEVAYHLFRIICLIQGDPGPQCGYDEVNVTYMYYGIIIAVDIRAYFKAIAIVQFCDVVELVELMVAHTGYYLMVILRCPVPEGMFGIVVIPQVADVTSHNENFPRHLQGILLQVSPVVGKLQMEVRRILYLHDCSMANNPSNCSSRASMNEGAWSRAFARGSERASQSFLIEATNSFMQVTIGSGAVI